MRDLDLCKRLENSKTYLACTRDEVERKVSMLFKYSRPIEIAEIRPKVDVRGLELFGV